MRRVLPFLLISSAVCFAQPDPFDQLLQDGRSALSAHRSPEAVSAGLKAIQLKPQRWEGYLLIASAMADQRSYGDALPFYYRAFVLAPPGRQAEVERLIEEVVSAKLSEPGRQAEGSWRGVLDLGAGKLPLTLDVVRSDKGVLTSTLHSPSQGSTEIPVVLTVMTDDKLHLEMPAIGAQFDGRLDARGASMTGTFRQRGASQPLVWQRVP